jgi:hypothetical protein
MGDEQKETTTLVIDRAALSELARTGKRVYVEHDSRDGMRLFATGFIAALDAAALLLEAGGMVRNIPLARLRRVEPVVKAGKRGDGAGKEHG